LRNSRKQLPIPRSSNRNACAYGAAAGAATSSARSVTPPHGAAAATVPKLLPVEIIGVKIRSWDRTGYCVLYKRLERGTFRVPQALERGARSVAIEAAEMAKILEGISLPPSKQRVRALAA
jgi:transposase